MSRNGSENHWFKATFRVFAMIQAWSRAILEKGATIFSESEGGCPLSQMQCRHRFEVHRRQIYPVQVDVARFSPVKGGLKVEQVVGWVGSLGFSVGSG